MSKKLVLYALITVGIAAAGVAQAGAATIGDATTGVSSVHSAENASTVNQRYFENDNCTGRSVDVPGISSANFDFPVRSHIGN